MIKKIYIPICNDSVDGKLFLDDQENPGCGGTQFTSIRLAMLLAKSQSDYEVFLLHHKKIEIENKPKNLGQIILNSFQDATSSIWLSDKQALMISPATLLKPILKQNIQKPKCKIVLWLRHPFYIDLSLIKARFSAYISVGTYQYYSNNPFYRPHWYIPNIFNLPSIMYTPRTHCDDYLNGATLQLVYLGALMPVKGFHHIIKQWEQIKSMFPEVKLHVIGSSMTWGMRKEHSLIPTTKAYAQEILKYLPVSDIRDGKVIFYGNMGKEKFDLIKKCHVALLNPTGRSEAFPACPLECMSMGVPVIASDDYGMSDTLRFFSELSIRSPKEIPDKLNKLVSDPLFYREISERSFALAQWYHSQTPQILLRWKQLFQMLHDSRSTSIPSNFPMFNFYGSKSKMIFRQAKKTLPLFKKFIC